MNPQTISVDIERLRKTAKMHRIPTDDLVGLSLHDEARSLRARLNRVVYSRGEKWMLPRWIIRGLENRTVSLIDSTTSLVNPYVDDNICIGLPGGHHFAIADSSGLICPCTACGSIDVWILRDNTLYFPAIMQEEDTSILEPVGPGEQLLTCRIHVGPVEFRRLVYSSDHDGVELVYNEVQLRNNSFEPNNFTFFVAVRPMSYDGVEPIDNIEYDPATGRVYSNHILILETDRRPTSVIMTSADDAGLPTELMRGTGRFDTSFSTARGLGTVVMRFDVRLGSTECQSLFFITPLEPIRRQGSVGTFPKSSASRDMAVEKWFRFDQSTVVGVFPDTNLNVKMAQLKALLASLALSTLQNTIPHSIDMDPIEQARVLSALTRIGAMDIVQEATRLLLPQLIDWRPSDTARAPLIWGILQSCEYCHDASYLQSIIEPAKRWAESLSSHLSSQRPVPASPVQTEQATLRTPSPPSESPVVPAVRDGTNAEEQWVQQLRDELALIEKMGRVDIAPASVSPGSSSTEPPPEKISLRELAGLVWKYAVSRSLVHLFSSMDNTEALHDLPQLSRELYSRIQSVSEVVLHDDSAIPMSDVQEQTDALHLLSALTLTGVTIKRSALSVLIQAIRARLLRSGLIRPPGETRYVSIPLTLRLAQAYAMLNDSDSMELFLVKTIGCGTRIGLLPELTDPSNPHIGSGPVCSITAAADLLLLLLNLLLREEDATLIALPSVPDEWFTSESPIMVANIPTRAGRMRIELGTSTNQHQIELQMDHLPQEIDVHLSSQWSITAVRSYGGNVVSRIQDDVSHHLLLVPLSNTVVLTFRR